MRHAHGDLQKDISLTANSKAKYKNEQHYSDADNKQKRQYRQHNGNKAYLEQW